MEISEDIKKIINLTEEIEKKKEHIERLKSEKIELEMLDWYQKTAIKLHGLCCHKNHIDECQWRLEIIPISSDTTLI